MVEDLPVLHSPFPALDGTGVTDLSVASNELQRRVRPYGWDVETLAPDLAVPHLELRRRDGKVKVRLQRAGRGWSIEVGWRREVIRRGFHRGPEYNAVEWDEQILRFNGRAELAELEDGLRVLAQVLVENTPHELQSHARGALETENGELETGPEARR